MKRKQHIDKGKRELWETTNSVNTVGKTKGSHNKAKPARIKSIMVNIKAEGNLFLTRNIFVFPMQIPYDWKGK